MNWVLLMDDDQFEKVIGINGDINTVRIHSAPGASSQNLKEYSAAMRKIMDHFHEAWRLLQMESPVSYFEAEIVRSDISDVSIYNTTALDTPLPKHLRAHEQSHIQMFTQLDDGSLVETSCMMGPTMHVSSDRPLHMDTIEYTSKKTLAFNEWEASCALFMDGQKVSRGRVVRYIADTRGGTHYDRGNARKKKAKDYGVLDRQSLQANINGRDPIVTLYMSICQEFVASKSVADFQAKVATLRKRRPER